MHNNSTLWWPPASPPTKATRVGGKQILLPWRHAAHNICNPTEAELKDKGFWLIRVRLHLQQELQLNPSYGDRPTTWAVIVVLYLWAQQGEHEPLSRHLVKGCSVAMERRLGKQRMERGGAEGEWTVEEGDVGHAVVSVLLRNESSRAFTQRCVRRGADSSHFLPLANKQAVLRRKRCLSSGDK